MLQHLSTPWLLCIALCLGVCISFPSHTWAQNTSCTPHGETPTGYTRHAIADKGRIDLTGDWKLGKSATFAHPRTVTLPGNIASPGGRRVWLRRDVLLPKGRDPSTMALDLGGRFGLSKVWVNGTLIPTPLVYDAPFFKQGGLPLVTGHNTITIEVSIPPSTAELRWYGDAALGDATLRDRGLVVPETRSVVQQEKLAFSLTIPPCADLTQPMPMIVALPGGGGSPWSYAATTLHAQAEQRGWLFLVVDAVPSAYYMGSAERAVIKIIDRVSRDFAVDSDRLYMTGFSMGGAGTLHIGYHYPDRFAAIAPFYPLTTYNFSHPGWNRLFRNSRTRHARYTVGNFPGNARNLPMLLVHAKDDTLVPFKRSQKFFAHSEALGFKHHTFLPFSKGGHSLQTIEAGTDAMLTFFESHRRPQRPPRISLATNHAQHSAAWWLRLKLLRNGVFAKADVEWNAATRTLFLHKLSGATRANVDIEALGLTPGDAHLQVITPTSSELWLGPNIRFGALQPGRYPIVLPP